MELKHLGFSDDDLVDAGYTRRAVEAVDGRSIRALKENGFDIAEVAVGLELTQPHALF